MKTANTAVTMMIIALVAMIGMLSGIGAATTTPGSYMDYNVNFDGMGSGSLLIRTWTPIGEDFQQVDWTNCEAVGTQTGNYENNGWMTIDRNTRIDTARANDTGTMNHDPVFGSVLTQTQMNTDGGDWTPGAVSTYATLNDSYIGNPPEDYVELDQITKLYDGDMQVGGTAGFEKILADTNISARLFDNGGNGYDAFNAGVITTSDATGNVSSAISGMLSEGEIFMDVDSRLIDDATNVESSRTDFDIDVPNMPGYSEQNTGSFAGQAAINGVITDQMAAVFTNVDNINTTGYFYTITP